MDYLEKQAYALNDLVKINNDRIEGYQKAIDELNDEDVDLLNVFQEMIDQSRQFHTELVSEVAPLGEGVAQGSMASGKIYRAWMDVKSFFTGGDRKTVLDNCEKGELAAIGAYDEALETEQLTPEQRAMIIRHQAEIKLSHTKIRSMKKAL